VVKLLNDTLEASLKIQSESEKRQAKPGAEMLRTELGILHFRRSA
jgi:hypothetical protein